MAARSRAGVCGSSLAGIAGSSPAGHGYLSLVVICVVRKRALRQAYQSSSEVLPSVVYLSVIVKPR